MSYNYTLLNYVKKSTLNPALPLMLTSTAATPVQNGQNALRGTLLDQEKNLYY